jgi:hypothetical protein
MNELDGFSLQPSQTPFDSQPQSWPWESGKRGSGFPLFHGLLSAAGE